MSSFSPFGRLPVELQLKVWSFALKPQCAEPRIIEIGYNPLTYKYKYKSQPPPLTQTCRNSREVALKNYSILNPLFSKEVGAIYFHQTIDILYYHTSNSRSANEILPFLNAELPMNLIQHLMFTEAYLSHRARDSFQCPIPELRYFANLKTLYIVLPSYAEIEEGTRTWYNQLMRFTPNKEPSLPQLTASYKREKIQEASEPRDVVPGYTLLPKDKGSLREHQVISCFGKQEGGAKNAWIFGDGLRRGGIKKVGDWSDRELPVVKYTRKVPEE